MNPYKINEGPFTSFIVTGVKYKFRKRFVRNVDRGNILDVWQLGKYAFQKDMYIGGTSIDLPYCLRKEARRFVLGIHDCTCDNCVAARKAGRKP